MSLVELYHTLIYAGCFLVLFALAELLYHGLKVNVEVTRKIVHLGTGLICLSFPLFLTTHWSVLILTLSFVFILWISSKLNLLKSINNIDRFSRGSLLYPIIIYLTYWTYTLFNDLLFFYLPILILAISDPLAALVGKKWPKGCYCLFKETKTLMGSGAFFLSSFVITATFVIPLRENWIEIIGITIFVSLVATAVEAVSQRGWDNLFIPLAVTGLLVLNHFFYHV